MVDLTVCYETNFKDAKSRKARGEVHGITRRQLNGFVVNLFILDIGSRGFMNLDSFYRLNGTLGALTTELLDLML